jgi:hypothetical protein
MKFPLLHGVFWLAVLTCSAGSTAAQTDSLRVQQALGLQVVLTNSGFGLGGYVSRGLPRDLRISFEASIGAAKDEREVAFFDRFGRRDVPNKANYLLEIPFQIGMEKRLFRSRIEDNFRPFILATGGPLLGWAYPYFEDKNRNSLLDDEERTFDLISGISKGHLEPGASFGLYIGAQFGEPGKSSQGVRIGYRLSYYKNPIALLDASIKDPSRRIGTPVITVYFGRSSAR